MPTSLTIYMYDLPEFFHTHMNKGWGGGREGRGGGGWRLGMLLAYGFF